MLKEVDPVPELHTFTLMHQSLRKAAIALGISATFLSLMLQRKTPVPKPILAKLNLKRAVVRETKKGKP